MLRELNHVMDHIEANLTEALSLEHLSAHAGVSGRHLQMVFYGLTGMTLGEYVKNRRLSEAGLELLQGARVTDVALQYGYQSTDGFTRAFKRWSGRLPSEVRKQGAHRAFPKLLFTIAVKGGIPMEFRIEEKPAFYLAGVSARVPMQFEGVNSEIVKLAERIDEGQRQEMRALQDMAPCEIVNASYDAEANFQKEEGFLTHLIGVLTTREAPHGRLEQVPVGACTWAVFPNRGPFPDALQRTMARVYAEWLPGADYEVIEAPTFSFTKPDADLENHAYSEIWVPVRRRR
ncbi:MAG: AraC family transcriptional regulator [Clostridiales bacterium]|nr:AraC family transcriptional regulator [Clostridiales bacterium]